MFALQLNPDDVSAAKASSDARRGTRSRSATHQHQQHVEDFADDEDGLLGSKPVRAPQLGKTLLRRSMAQRMSKSKQHVVLRLESPVSIPPVKINQHGIGFDPFHNAPEFAAAHRAKQQLRQQLAALGTSTSRNVYHTDHLKENVAADSDDKMDDSNWVLGASKRSLTGFNLDDEDDDGIYDTRRLEGVAPTKSLRQQQYHHEIIDVEDSGSEEDRQNDTSAQRVARPTQAFSAKLGSWATTDALGDGNGSSLLTSDGKPPLQGFVIGRSSSHDNKMPVRYPGPQVPSNFKPHHVFSNEQEQELDQLLLLQEKERKDWSIRAMKFRQSSNVTLQPQPQPASHSPPSQQVPPQPQPPTGAAFASLISGIHSRFASESSQSSIVVEEPSRPAGLSDASTAPTTDALTNSVRSSTPHVHHQRTRQPRQILSFLPASLLCKRFQVTPPTHPAIRLAGSTADGTIVHSNLDESSKPSEESFFRREVAPLIASSETSALASRAMPKKDQWRIESGPDTTHDTPESFQRPSMDLFKSIFEPEEEVEDEASSREKGASPDAELADHDEVQDQLESQLHKADDALETLPVSQHGSMNSSSSSQSSIESDVRQKHRKHSRSRRSEKDRERRHRKESKRGNKKASRKRRHEHRSIDRNDRRPKKRHKRRRRHSDDSSSDGSSDSGGG